MKIVISKLVQRLKGSKIRQVAHREMQLNIGKLVQICKPM